MLFVHFQRSFCLLHHSHYARMVMTPFKIWELVVFEVLIRDLLSAQVTPWIIIYWSDCRRRRRLIQCIIVLSILPIFRLCLVSIQRSLFSLCSHKRTQFLRSPSHCHFAWICFVRVDMCFASAILKNVLSLFVL